MKSSRAPTPYTPRGTGRARELSSWPAHTARRGPHRRCTSTAALARDEALRDGKTCLVGNSCLRAVTARAVGLAALAHVRGVDRLELEVELARRRGLTVAHGQLLGEHFFAARR